MITTDGTITVITKDSSGNALLATGTTVPTDGGSGYAKGCIFVDTDVAAGASGVYENVGTTTACDFRARPLIKSITQAVAYDDFTDGGSTAGTLVMTDSIPKGAVALQSFITDVTGFAGDTSAVLTIGDGSDVDRYNTGTPNVFATATDISAGAVSGTAFHAAAVTPTLTVTGAADFTSVSAGAATITIMYLEA